MGQVQNVHTTIDGTTKCQEETTQAVVQATVQPNLDELMSQLPIGLIENFYGALLYENFDIINEKRQSVK